MHRSLTLITFIFSIASVHGADLSRFKESSSGNVKCMGDDAPTCVQAAPDSDKACTYHDDCKIGCRQGETVAKCFEKGEIDRRNPVSNEMGAARGIPNPCIQFPGLSGHCGCLPQARRCGQMTDKYLHAATAKGNVIGLFSSQKKIRCLNNGDCKSACNAAGKGNDSIATQGPGGLPCGCLPDVKLCGFSFELMPK
jgi:hypothetical protein